MSTLDIQLGLDISNTTTVKLSEICSVDWGNTSITKGSYVPSGYPAFSATGMDGALDFYEHDGEAIIVSAIGAKCGKCFYATGKWSAIKNTIVIKALNPEKVDLMFLYYTVNNEDFWPRSGSGQPFISIGKAQAIKLQLPSLSEQRAIARTLRTVKDAIQARRRELELERERKAALMHHLFTYGTRGEPTKQTEIGEMPESWQIVRLESLLREKLKNGYSAVESSSGTGIRTLTLSAVTQNDFSAKNTKVTVADDVRVRDLWLKAGDIFIERANTRELVGSSALYEGDDGFAIYSDLLIRIRLNREIIPHFAIEYLQLDVCKDYFRKNASGAAGNMPKIDHRIVNDTLVLHPPLSEQVEIASIAKAAYNYISALSHEIMQLDELFRSLLEELMSGRLSTLPLTKEE